jgi:hypothetical protein
VAWKQTEPIPTTVSKANANTNRVSDEGEEEEGERAQQIEGQLGDAEEKKEEGKKQTRNLC